MGTILEAGRVPKADKLLCFKIDLGEAEPRQILSGIAEHFEPETLVGRQVCVVANLAPRKIRGLVSAGMILTAEAPDGKLTLLAPGGDVAPGSKISEGKRIDATGGIFRKEGSPFGFEFRRCGARLWLWAVGGTARPP